ncbi:MAG TPA: nuclear transport factor 2 family protein [Acidimicrobiia bacterium]|nr:nuclear transport factor 2 family protein [Acidimicrobiia bacterium]
MGLTEVRAAVEQIVYGYADRVDAGDFVGLAALFRHATYKGGGPDDPGVFGSDAVLAIQERMVRRYPDGTPRTKHVTTNLTIDADEEAGTATARSYFTVLQQVDDFALQAIIAGRYHDRFERVADEWRLTERVIFCDLVGDLSHHLTVDPFEAR